ncbi:hypothetical protein L914_00496 [Phytophthora nicotianae]|uniref:Uncharacterized protein n=1 Tax=Phytophthora nicotianae TaxID=4792 RepID=W2P6C6_PHYNI|nr:hypothetical protein L914_00496 [Phytophthora nicotianae]
MPTKWSSCRASLAPMSMALSWAMSRSIDRNHEAYIIIPLVTCKCTRHMDVRLAKMRKVVADDLFKRSCIHTRWRMRIHGGSRAIPCLESSNLGREASCFSRSRSASR